MIKETGRNWTMVNGDSCEWLPTLPEKSVDVAVFSPPFASLFAYSDDPRDLSNNASYEEFLEHYAFIARGLARVMKPGRVVCCHCMVIPTSKSRDGYIGMRDLPGDLVREHTKAGFIFHGKTVIWKDPVVQMQRTKALGLLHKQLKKDSTMSRMGLPDEVLFFRAPGENETPVSHTADDFPVAQWQRYASPVWDDVDQSDVLPTRAAKEEGDQKHLCPLQLDVIRRCLRLYSNPCDLVLTPFGGVGSEPVVAIQEGRRAIGCELKASYFRQAVANLRAAEQAPGDLFGSLNQVAGATDLPPTE
jgi:DNA modification methylase